MIKQNNETNYLFVENRCLTFSITNNNIVLSPSILIPNNYRNIYYGHYFNNIIKFDFRNYGVINNMAKELYKL